MPNGVKLAQRTESTGHERALWCWLVGPMLAGALPTCHGAIREDILIEKLVHRRRLLRHRLG